VRWLPAAAGEWLLGVFAGALGSLPQCEPGRELPPLRTAGGVPFGALLCYDNAFPGPAAAQVAQGARLLCVLSNESWYEGGAELPQLVAMSVLRALENGTPLVRCTQDGWSAVVGRDGRVLAELPLAPAPQPAARTLRASVPLGPGAPPPLAGLRAATGPLAAFGLVALLVAGRRRRLPVAI
jgi:apolipoprotein N-acyltransferase